MKKTLLLAGTAAAFVGIPALRRATLSKGVMTAMNRLGFLPTISPTEKTAIEAGTVWMDGELFSGHPDFEKLLAQPYPDLTPDEQAFLDGPCEALCRMVDDWDVMQRRDLSPETWDFIKRERFFGMIIPREYGGLGFGASANSAVVAKLAARSQALAITVMVPNSLGPAELLIHYGTAAQRDRYLPGLAVGDEVPCFALTEPGAGSDAGAISATGDVFRGDDGALYLRLNWKKRYITLAAISTVLGLAFKLRDPQNLLGGGRERGITCALIPTQAPGVRVDRRHDPLGIPFYNCPTEGRDVVVKLDDAVIGGAEGVGRGWRMLMESLAAGRGISLPATATGTAKMVYRVAGAHAAVRRQFGLPIGHFEGVEEPLARIGGFTYIMEAARRYTNGGLDGGAKPAVVAAIMKYNTTELGRRIINDGMDVLGGNAISRGPRNALAAAYGGTPISITVEGANILTRTLMIFGQGAIRCHPYIFREVEALEGGNLEGFDRAFWGHVGHTLMNGGRAKLLSLTRGALAHAPVDGPAAPYYRKLAWASASFAFLADVALASLGGTLKRKEKVTGRFADLFSWLYLGNAVLARFEREGRLEEDAPFMHWAMQYALYQMQQAFDGLYANLDVPGLGAVLRGPIALWSRLNTLGGPPSDALGHQVARAMQTPGAQRDRHTRGLFVSDSADDPLGRLEHALQLVTEAAPLEKRVREAVKAGGLEKAAPDKVARQAVEKGVLSAGEADLLARAEQARADAVAVDAFSLDAYLHGAASASAETAAADPAGVLAAL